MIDAQLSVHFKCYFSSENLENASSLAEDREALTPVYTFSFNHKLPVIYLGNEPTPLVFYASGHLGIIHDIQNKNQYILRGHVWYLL